MPDQAFLPCLLCGKTLDNSVPAELVQNQPSDATEFTTYGHYGSTFWDSFDGEQIVINVCDDCLRQHTSRIGRHKRYRVLTCQGFHVGREYVDRQLVPFTFDEETGDAREVPQAQLGEPRQGVQWAEPDYLAAVRESLSLVAKGKSSESGVDTA